jgi:hypothetical protein
MLLDHGTTSAEDLKKLRAPLYEPLKALADLEPGASHERVPIGVQEAD